jgi:hypothetical protein
MGLKEIFKILVNDLLLKIQHFTLPNKQAEFMGQKTSEMWMTRRI